MFCPGYSNCQYRSKKRRQEECAEQRGVLIRSMASDSGFIQGFGYVFKSGSETGSQIAQLQCIMGV